MVKRKKSDSPNRTNATQQKEEHLCLKKRTCLIGLSKNYTSSFRMPRKNDKTHLREQGVNGETPCSPPPPFEQTQRHLSKQQWACVGLDAEAMQAKEARKRQGTRSDLFYCKYCYKKTKIQLEGELYYCQECNHAVKKDIVAILPQSSEGQDMPDVAKMPQREEKGKARDFA